MIASQIRRAKTIAACATVGVVLVIINRVTGLIPYHTRLVPTCMLGVCATTYLAALWCYIEAKGRSILWLAPFAFFLLMTCLPSSDSKGQGFGLLVALASLGIIFSLRDRTTEGGVR